MCQKVTNLFDCGHTKEPSVLHPKDPEDCPEAVQANRHNARTGKLLPCLDPPTTRANTGGYCQTTKCKKWYLKQYGWYCCQCQTQIDGADKLGNVYNTCFCEHSICRKCRSVVSQEDINHQPRYEDY
ncbi:hypothetical protein PspLS_12137 [Pyricularia sp. CBS 133598]|nr:hypothetical protein PspLS_12137 [Pyricularia sp. CBS 133598]